MRCDHCHGRIKRVRAVRLGDVYGNDYTYHPLCYLLHEAEEAIAGVPLGTKSQDWLAEWPYS